MNILYINANQRNKLSHTAGYATHMAKTIKGFEAAGHRVVKFLAGEALGADGAKQAYRTMSSYLPHRAARLVRDVYEVVHDHKLYRKWLPLAAKEQIHFVYERMNHLHTCGLRLARGLGVPFVIEINDPMRETVTVDLSSLMKQYAIFLEDRLVREADFVVLGSEELKKSYVRRGFPAEKLLVLYPTADLEMFRPGLPREEIKRRFGLDGKIVVGFVAGGISAGWRRPDLLLDVLSAVMQKHPQASALIVGDGTFDGVPRSLGSARSAEALVLTGKVPYADVPDFIKAMDICVIPGATWYGSPTKLFEYGAMAKPVVAPRLPPIQEVVDHGVTGLLFEPGDHGDMLRQIVALMESPSRRQELGRNLRQRLQSRYTWEANTKTVIEAVENRRR